MGGPDKKNQPLGNEEDKSKTPPPVPIEDDDGDFATPKRDYTGNDDEPL